MRRLRLLTLSLTAVLALAPTASSGSVAVAHETSSTSPIVHAHRGGAAEAPENTLGAFERAWGLYGDSGVVLEMDLWLAADGVLVVHHDSTLDRTTDCGGRIIDKTAAELADCDAAATWPTWSTEHVPTFREVLDAGLLATSEGGPAWRIMPELKGIPGDAGFDPTGVAPADALVDDLLATGYPLDSVTVQSFWPTSLDAVDIRLAREGLAVDTALLTSSALVADPQIGFAAHQNALYAAVRGYEVTAPREDARDLGPTTASAAIAAAHAVGRRVVPYTVDDPTRMLELAAAGVDGLITNAPALAYATLAGAD